MDNMSELDNIKRRILLARKVADHPNTSKEERANALGRIAHLLDEWHLSVEDIAEEIDNPIESVLVAVAPSPSLWPTALSSLTASLHSTVSHYHIDADTKEVLGVIFTGNKIDVEASLVTWNILYKQMLNLAIALRQNTLDGKLDEYLMKYKDPYGLPEGIDPRFSETYYSFIRVFGVANTPVPVEKMELTPENMTILEDSWAMGILKSLTDRLIEARDRTRSDNTNHSENALIINRKARIDATKEWIKNNLNVGKFERDTREINEHYRQIGKQDADKIKMIDPKQIK